MTDERPITGSGAAKFSRDERPIGGKRVKKRGEVDDWGSVDSAKSKALQERAKQVVVKLEPEMREWAAVGLRCSRGGEGRGGNGGGGGKG